MPRAYDSCVRDILYTSGSASGSNLYVFALYLPVLCTRMASTLTTGRGTNLHVSSGEVETPALTARYHVHMFVRAAAASSHRSWVGRLLS